MTRSRMLRVSALSLSALLVVGLKTGPTAAQAPQSGLIDDSIHRYVNLDQRVAPGPGGGSGVDGDDVSEYPASATATFSNYTLNGITEAEWNACRGDPNFGTVQECLESLIGDGNGDGVVDDRDLHAGEIGGDVFEFDLTITNTSSNAVLTAFGFQSKFSESPALGSRIGDKLFKAERVAPSGSLALGGVKKNGTSNGLFDGKRKFICVSSSTDYPPELNAGTDFETLECAGGRNFDPDTSGPVLVDAEGDEIDPEFNLDLPKGLEPGGSMTIRLRLDAGTDDGALHRAARDPPGDLSGPLTGELNLSGSCPTLEEGSGNIVELVDFGDVKILQDNAGNCAPSFYPFEKNQFLTFPRGNWGFTDILDTRDDWPTDPSHPDREIDQTLNDPGIDGLFSFLDRENLVMGELNFASLVKGFGEHGATLDPACDSGGSQPGACGGAPYVPIAEFYAISDGKLVRQEVAGSYAGNGISIPLQANVDQATAANVKAEDPFEETGNLTPPAAIGASASIEFFDFEVIADDPATAANEGGQAGGNKFRVSLRVENTSTSSNVLLTSINFQTKERALTDINDRLDGSSIEDRRDLRLDDSLPDCSAATDVRCWDEALGIGRFPNVIGNSLLSVDFVGSPGGPLRFIKKNGPFQPLAAGFQNFVCIKSGAQSDDEEIDQDVIETCAGEPTEGLAPGQSQTLRLEFDYGDFRGLIVRVQPGTLVAQGPPFGLAQQGGDFDCRDQRRLPYCHPDLVGQDWFIDPVDIADVVFLTVHQQGDAPTVMNFAQNFGQILAMGAFIPSAEFSNGTVRQQVVGEYCTLPGGAVGCESTGGDPGGGDPPPDPAPEAAFGTMCTGLTCSFSDMSEGSIASWSWSFGDGGSSNDQNPSHTYAAAGTYLVELTVANSGGLSDSASQQITVSAATPVISLSLSPQRVRGQHEVTLTWSGATTSQVDIHRNGSRLTTVANNPAGNNTYLDRTGGRGSASYTYRVCEAGSTTVCSDEVTTNFN